jgi:hypothetical protein
MTKKPWEEEYDLRPAPKRGPWDDYAPGTVDYGSRGGMSPFETFFSGAADGATLGWGDEMLGGLAAAGDAVGLSGLWGGMTGDQVRNWSRAQQKVAQYANPFLYGAGQFAGAVGGGLATGGIGNLALRGGGAAATGLANIGARAGLGTRLAAAAGTGAVGGATYGAGSAEDANKVEAGLTGAWQGALSGGLMQGGLIEPFGAAWRNAIKPSFDANYKGARTMAQLFDRHGGGDVTKKLTDKLEKAPSNALVMDVVPGGTQITSAAGVRPSAAKDTLRDVLDERNNRMGDDAAEELWESTVGKNQRVDAGMRIHALNAAQKQIDYSDIDAMQITPTLMAKDFVAHHLRQPNAAFKGAIEDAMEAVRIDDPNVIGLRIVGDQISLGDMIHYPKFWRSLWTNVREDVRKAEQSAMFTGMGGSQLRTLQADARNLRKNIGDILGDKWEAKQAAYKVLADEEDALRMGYDAVAKAGDIKLGDALTEISAARNKFQTDAAKEKFDLWIKKGAMAHVEDMLNRADTGSGRADVLRSIMGNKSKITTLNQLLGRATKGGAVDQRTNFAKTLKRLDAQRELFDNSVKSGIGVNSHTADRLAGQASLEAVASGGGIRGMLVKALAGNSQDEFNENVSNRVLNFMSRPASELRQEIATAGGVKKWLASLGKDDLIAIALAAQKPAFRQKELGKALNSGLYSMVGFDAALTGIGLGGGE